MPKFDKVALYKHQPGHREAHLSQRQSWRFPFLTELTSLDWGRGWRWLVTVDTVTSRIWTWDTAVETSLLYMFDGSTSTLWIYPYCSTTRFCTHGNGPSLLHAFTQTLVSSAKRRETDGGDQTVYFCLLNHCSGPVCDSSKIVIKTKRNVNLLGACTECGSVCAMVFCRRSNMSWGLWAGRRPESLNWF